MYTYIHVCTNAICLIKIKFKLINIASLHVTIIFMKCNYIHSHTYASIMFLQGPVSVRPVCDFVSRMSE